MDTMNESQHTDTPQLDESQVMAVRREKLAEIRKHGVAFPNDFRRNAFAGDREYWLFAHNGHLGGFQPEEGQYYRPVGSTDSERAFCFILEQLRNRFEHKPPVGKLFAEVAALTAQIRHHGLFNFMLSNGEILFAHASTLLYYIIRQAPFGEAHLIDNDVAIDFAAVTTPNDRVAVIATQPLTANETWTQLAVNELVAFRDGDIILRDCPDNPRYLSQQEGLAIARAAGVAA